MKKIVAANANPVIIEYIKSKGYDVELFGPLENVADPIKYHPDLLYTRLTDDYVFKGEPWKLGTKYPEDVRYNACSTGKYFIHNFKYTDELLLAEAERLGLKMINVRQGYSKCSIIPVDQESIITFDEGIEKSCRVKGLKILTVNKLDVFLPGYPTGFIGGATGRLDNEILFNGNISAHPDYLEIKKFIESRNLTVKYFDNYPLTDIGSII